MSMPAQKRVARNKRSGFPLSFFESKCALEEMGLSSKVAAGRWFCFHYVLILGGTDSVLYFFAKCGKLTI